MVTIALPHKFNPRDYQLPLLRALDNGFLRAIQVWHRRSGKDKVDFNYMVRRAWQEKGMYYYFFPTYAQGKKVIWDGMDNTGFKFLDHIPQSLIKRIDNGVMLVELKNGSIIQIIGTENIDSIVGTNPRGCVFSEFSLQDPRAWQFIRPILAANGGWAIFNFTPRGRNHAFELKQMAEKDTDTWFVSVLTVADTKAISDKVLEQEKKEMYEQTGNDALYLQEYFVSFDAPVEGAYYAKHLLLAEEEKRITAVPYDPTIPVDTYWDLGIGDSMSIWFAQRVGMEIHFIDYYESSGEGMVYYARVLQDKGYVYGEHYAPHDIEVRELSTGKSRKETAQSLGINFRVAPRLPIDDGIDACRNLFGRCWFDKIKCDRGINSLSSYHKEWDDKNKVYKNHPEHDWASHGADAFRTFGVTYRQQVQSVGSTPVYQPSDTVIGI